MSQSDAQKKALVKYEKNHYDRILLRLPKGYKAKIQKHIGEESMNAYLKRLVDQDLNS